MTTETLDRLKEQIKGRNLREVADGAQVGQSWLRMWMRGEIPDPSYTRITKLTEYLKRAKRKAA